MKSNHPQQPAGGDDGQQTALPDLVFAVPIIMLAVALLRMPYGYYELLRRLVCAASAWISYRAYTRHAWTWMAIFAFVALAYNPAFRVRLEREVWAWVNCATISVFFIAALQNRKRGQGAGDRT